VLAVEFGPGWLGVALKLDSRSVAHHHYSIWAFLDLRDPKWADYDSSRLKYLVPPFLNHLI
jgi:hypothetical protein